MNAKEYTEKLGLSEQMGHVISLQGKLYVTVAGLRTLAQRAKVASIDLEPVWNWCQPDKGVFYVRCVVVMPGDRTFAEYGSSHGSKVGSRGGNHALLGHAATRATGRALRNALEIELPLFEESGLQGAETHQNKPKPRQQAPSSEFQRYAQALQRASSTGMLQTIANNCKDEVRNKDELSKLRAIYKDKHAVLERQEEEERSKAMSAYFAQLKESKYSKEDSDAAIASKYNAESHSTLWVEALRDMHKQVRGKYDGPPGISVQPFPDAMFQVHLEYAYRQRQKQ